jgi:hypothetical protein
MGFPTLLDISTINGSDALTGLIKETNKVCPEVRLGAARTIKGVHYKTLVRTSLPTVGFRNANEGTAVSKSTYENRIVECFTFNPPWECDKSVADRHDKGKNAYLALEGEAVMEAAMISLGRQFYYGTAADAKGFPGLNQMVDSTMVVDAGGTTDDTASSVWGVRFGPQHVQWVWGEEGLFELSEISDHRVVDANGNPYLLYHQEILAYPGLQVGSIYSAARLCNLTADSGKGLTDDLVFELLGKFPSGTAPDVLLMSRRSLEQLRKSRTAVNMVGAPAPVPPDVSGIPIVTTDSIVNTEALVV